MFRSSFPWVDSQSARADRHWPARCLLLFMFFCLLGSGEHKWQQGEEASWRWGREMLAVQRWGAVSRCCADIQTSVRVTWSDEWKQSVTRSGQFYFVAKSEGAGLGSVHRHYTFMIETRIRGYPNIWISRYLQTEMQTQLLSSSNEL